MGFFSNDKEAWAGRADKALNTVKFTFKVGGKTLVFFIPKKYKARLSKLADKAKGEHNCVECNKRLKGSDRMCLPCAKNLKDEVDSKFPAPKTISLYDSRGRNVNTNKHYSCGCNMLNTFHNCVYMDGQRIRDNIRKKPGE